VRLRARKSVHALKSAQQKACTMTQDASDPAADPALVQTIAALLRQISDEPVSEEIARLAKELQVALDAQRAIHGE
jgi:hypothetical protein